MSATPIRQYDEIGTEELFDYFGGEVFSFKISDAIGVCLVPYRYYVHVVELTHEETEKYADLTRKIRKLSQCSHVTECWPTDPYLDQLIRTRES